MTTLRQLRFLVALADTASFSRAAEACCVTQPTLSAGVKELEASLGAPLAERTTRTVILTELGRAAAERAREVLAAVREIEAAAAGARGPLGGKITLGAAPTIGPYLLPQALPAIRERFPELKVFLREELTESLLEGLGAGRLDAALLALPFEIGDLAVAPLFEDGYQLATPLGFRAARDGPASGADLLGAPLLLLERGHCLQRHALSAFPGLTLKRDESFSATSLATLIAMVGEGLGVTLLPQLAVDAGVADGARVTLTPLVGACPRQVALVWRKSSAHGADFERLADIFRAARR